MNALFILNDPPYGNERTYNGLRLALALAKTGAIVSVFLMGDAVIAAKKGQKTPEGSYNVERVLKRFSPGEHRILACGTCMDARGLGDVELVDGARRSSMDELAQATLAADKLLVF
jgi:uncharacterized protein involved in oxidation of intracellular sulfur